MNYRDAMVETDDYKSGKKGERERVHARTSTRRDFNSMSTFTASLFRSK